jgi:hypothetical protein
MSIRRRITLRLGGSVIAAIAFLALASPVGAASPPSFHLTPGPYYSGEKITLSVGPNHFFRPYAHINILECADPEGKKAALPINENNCDGNTIQGNTVLIAKNGSFSEHGYVLYALPNLTALDEQAGGRPICNKGHECVLYVGENQSSFTWPKLFSPPFVISSRKK